MVGWRAQLVLQSFNAIVRVCVCIQREIIYIYLYIYYMFVFMDIYIYTHTRNNFISGFISYFCMLFFFPFFPLSLQKDSHLSIQPSFSCIVLAMRINCYCSQLSYVYSCALPISLFQCKKTVFIKDNSKIFCK